MFPDTLVPKCLLDTLALHLRGWIASWLLHNSCATVTFYYNIFQFILPQICKIFAHYSGNNFNLFYLFFCKLANCFKCIVYTNMQILLYLGGELQSLVISMSSCSAQCILLNRQRLSRDHKTHTHRAVLVDFKQSTRHHENGGRQRINAFAGRKQV